MTLYKQLVLIIVLMCVLIFLGTLGVNIHSTRLFLNEQLESHAQDTATSLSLSLSPHMVENDISTMTAMIDAIFDRGYYSEIRLLDMDGEPLIERTSTRELDGIPRFVVDWIELDTPQAEASVMSGWNLGGVIQVHSHPGFAYRQLWRITIRMLTWFVFVALSIGALGALGIHALLKPLRALEKQAEGVCAREYEIQEGLPRTRELRRVVIAMNRMTAKVKAMFEEQAQSAQRMRELAYQDAVTGLGNRRYFDGQLHAAVQASDELHKGALVLVQINGLQEINDQRGFEAGDDLIRAAGDILQTALGSAKATIARLAGADFGVLLAGVDKEQLTATTETLVGRLADLYGQGLSDDSDISHAGATLLAAGQTPGALLAQADQALRGAQASGPNSWRLFAAEPATSVTLGRHGWKDRLEQVIRDRKLVLHAQPVVAATDRAKVLHREVLVRIPSDNGDLWTAGAFMPVAEELGLARQLDRIMLYALIDHLLEQPERADYALNLSPGCLRDEDFLSWLYQTLERTPPEKGRLIVEFSEFGVVREQDELRAVSTRVRALGHGIALDHFGQAFAAFGYLQSLRPDYVKIDGGFTAKVTEDRDDQFFVQNLCSIAHSLDIQTIAEMVETEEQWRLLQSLQVDGVQGYAVARPGPLKG